MPSDHPTDRRKAARYAARLSALARTNDPRRGISHCSKCSYRDDGTADITLDAQPPAQKGDIIRAFDTPESPKADQQALHEWLTNDTEGHGFFIHDEAIVLDALGHCAHVIAYPPFSHTRFQPLGRALVVVRNTNATKQELGK